MKRRKKRSLPDVLTNEEVALLLSSFPVKIEVPCRNRLIIELALKTGMRMSELINLKWTDVDTESGRIHIKEGKGQKDRIVYVNPEFFVRLNEYYEKFNKTKNIYVFENHKGGKLIDRGLREMIQHKSAKLGLKKRIYFHLFRHTYLTNIYKKTQDIRLVQEIAGHSNIETTMMYTHLASDKVKNVMLNYDTFENN